MGVLSGTFKLALFIALVAFGFALWPLLILAGLWALVVFLKWV